MGRQKRARMGARIRTGVIAVAALSLVADLGAVPIPWLSTAIDSSVDGANSLELADLDGDGDLDLVGAAQVADDVLWWPNNGGTWGTALTIDSSFNGAFTVRAADIDRDGDLDVVATALQGDDVVWWENDGTPANNTTDDGNGNFWTEFPVDISLNGARHVEPADLDGDGDLDLVVSGLLQDAFVWYENDGSPKDNTTDDGSGNYWVQRSIATGTNGAAMATTADIDEDGDLDVATVARLDDTVTWFANDGDPSDGGWVAHNVQPAFMGDALFDGPRSIAIADVNGDGEVDLVAAAGDGGQIAWWENDGSPADDTGGDGNSWTQHDVITSPSATSAPFLALPLDLDGDGDVDFAASFEGDDVVRWFENQNGAGTTWGVSSVSDVSLDAVRGLVAGDADGDGDLDIANATHDGDSVGLWTNDTVHRSALFVGQDPPVASAGEAMLARKLLFADLDDDGNLDAVSTGMTGSSLVWWRNDGDPLNETGDWQQFQIATFASGHSPSVADLDGDGDLDILTLTANAGLVYLENLGDPTVGVAGWTRREIDFNFGRGGTASEFVDLDRDGDLDVVVADQITDTILWWENDGTLPDDGTPWPTHGIAPSLTELHTLAIGDFDQDGDPDVVGASLSADRLAWWENDGSPVGDSSWTEHGIQPSVSNRVCMKIAVADVDGDGDLDVATCNDQGLGFSWFENDGSPANDSTWSSHLLASDLRPSSIGTADLDLDGDTDLWAAGFLTTGIRLFDNLAGDGSSFSSTVAISAVSDATAQADIDADGLPDLAVLDRDDHSLRWYRNRGGQYALATSSGPPPPPGTEEQPLRFLAPSTSHSALTMQAIHRGRAGDSDARIDKIGLALLDGDDDSPLTQGEVGALLSKVELFWQDPMGGPDQLVVDTAPPFPTDANGVLLLDLAGNLAAQTVAQGSPQTYRVVISTQPNANLATPNKFVLARADLRAAPESTAVDSHEIALSLEYQDLLGVGAHAFLQVSSCGLAADHLIIAGPQTLIGFELFQACMSLRTTGDVEVGSGLIVFNAADSVELGDGFSAAANGELEIAVGAVHPPP